MTTWSPRIAPTVTLAIGTNAGGGTLSGTLPRWLRWAASATFDDPGDQQDRNQGYTLTASDGGLVNAVSGSFNITPASADHLQFGQQPTDRTAGTSITPARSPCRWLIRSATW